MPTGEKRIIRRPPRAASSYDEDEEERPRRTSRDDEDRPRRSRDDEDDRPRSRDDDDEPPRRTSRDDEDRPRRSRDRDEEDDPPRASRRTRDDEDDDRPARSRSRDDEEERPVRSRSRDDEEPRRSSRHDEDDERPRRSSRDSGAKTIASGWAGAAQIRKETPSDFAGNFTPPSEPAIIKFLEPEPIASYHQHWADWLPAGSKLGYVCPKVDCPLCDRGVAVRGTYCFNIVDFSDPKNPTNLVWRVGIKVSNLIEKLAKQPRSGPLDRPDLYFEVSRSGMEGGGGRKAAGKVQTNLVPVKARDLEEEYRIQPLDDDEITDYEKKAFSKTDIVEFSTRKELEAVADALKD